MGGRRRQGAADDNGVENNAAALVPGAVPPRRPMRSPPSCHCRQCRPARRSAARGFTLIEMMVVIAIIVVLALIALPGVPDKLIRDRIVESLKLTDIVKAPVAATWARAVPQAPPPITASFSMFMP